MSFGHVGDAAGWGLAADSGVGSVVATVTVPGISPRPEPSVRSLVAGLRGLDGGLAGTRLISVGGAGSLRISGGKQIWGTEGLPELLFQHARGWRRTGLASHRQRCPLDDDQPAPHALIGPGSRTGTYRSALDELIVGEDDKNRVSTDDFAVAVVDEIEHPRHVNERFTVGY